MRQGRSWGKGGRAELCPFFPIVKAINFAPGVEESRREGGGRKEEERKGGSLLDMPWSSPQGYLLLCRNLWLHVSSLRFYQACLLTTQCAVNHFFPSIFCSVSLYIFYSWWRREIRRKHWGCCSIFALVFWESFVSFCFDCLACDILSYFWAAF